MRVLIVDDEKIVTLVLSELISESHDVEMASSGQEALRKFTPQRYGLVLIDLSLPDVPGNRVAMEMRTMDPLVVTVMMTGERRSEPDAERASEFDFHLPKPITIDGLEAVLAQGVELYSCRS